MPRRGCARTFARPPLRSAVPPGLAARKGLWKKRLCARTFARPPLRSAVPPGLAARKGQWKERLRADFCAPSLRSAVPPGLVARKGPWKERLHADFCARSFEERRSPRDWWPARTNGRKDRARTFARPPLRSAVPRDWWPWKERSRADFCAPSFEERRFPRNWRPGRANGRKGRARTFARPPLRSAASPRD